MIAHVSVPAKDSRATALLLAQLIDGEAFHFPVVAGSWIAIARDNSGLAIEVYPDTMAHHPGIGTVDPMHKAGGPQTMPWEDQIYPDGQQLRPSAFHLALTTHLSEEQVLSLARKSDLRVVGCDRGGLFRVIELWLDNTILVEVLTTKEVQRYQAFMNPQACAEMFGKANRPAE